MTGPDDTQPASSRHQVALAWLAYFRAQLRGDTTVLPPADVGCDQQTFEEEF